MRHCVLHIGMSKSGTSFIQNFMAENKKTLQLEGYSVFFRPRIMPSVIIDPSLKYPLFKELGLKSVREIEEFQKNKSSDIKANIEKKENAFFSSEWFCGFSEEEIERLHCFLKDYFDAFSIVIYIRRQDRYAVSLYTLRMINGETSSSCFDLKPRLLNKFYYYQIIKKWISVFGKDSIRVRVFETGEFLNGSFVDDFLDASRISGGPYVKEIPTANQSINHVGQEFLRRLNYRLPRFVSGRPNVNRKHIINYVKENFSGRGKVPERDEAISFFKKFSVDNENTRKNFFGDRGSIFDNDFTSYPVEIESLDLEDKIQDLSRKVEKKFSRN